MICISVYFNPRSPYGERHNIPPNSVLLVDISIHAPLTGSDPHPRHGQVNSDDFNPRSPYGERLGMFVTMLFSYLFQSTLPLRGATDLWSELYRVFCISIHAPLTGSDIVVKETQKVIGISIHAPLTGSDHPQTDSRALLAISIHAPLTGSDLCLLTQLAHSLLFQSTLPLRGATICLKGGLFIVQFQSTLPLRGATKF